MVEIVVPVFTEPLVRYAEGCKTLGHWRPFARRELRAQNRIAGSSFPGFASKLLETTERPPVRLVGNRSRNASRVSIGPAKPGFPASILGDEPSCDTSPASSLRSLLVALGAGSPDGFASSRIASRIPALPILSPAPLLSPTEFCSTPSQPTPY